MDEDTHIYHNFMLCKERFVRWTEKDTNPSQVLDMDPEKIGRHFLGRAARGSVRNRNKKMAVRE